MKSRKRLKFTAMELKKNRHFEQIEEKGDFVILRHVISKDKIRVSKEEIGNILKWRKGWISLK